MEQMAQEMELQATTDLFSKYGDFFLSFFIICSIVSMCLEKCVNSSYKDSDLTKVLVVLPLSRQAEAVCLDRCVAKFFTVHQFVGKRLNEMQQTSMGGEQGPPS